MLSDESMAPLDLDTEVGSHDHKNFFPVSLARAVDYVALRLRTEGGKKKDPDGWEFVKN